jgi:hypothetical protein
MTLTPARNANMSQKHRQGQSTDISLLRFLDNYGSLSKLICIFTKKHLFGQNISCNNNKSYLQTLVGYKVSTGTNNLAYLHTTLAMTEKCL